MFESAGSESVATRVPPGVTDAVKCEWLWRCAVGCEWLHSADVARCVRWHLAVKCEWSWCSAEPGVEHGSAPEHDSVMDC